MDRQKENVLVVSFVIVMVIIVFLLATSILDEVKVYAEKTQSRYEMYEEMLDESLPAGSGK